MAKQTLEGLCADRNTWWLGGLTGCPQRATRLRADGRLLSGMCKEAFGSCIIHMKLRCTYCLSQQSWQSRAPNRTVILRANPRRFGRLASLLLLLLIPWLWPWRRLRSWLIKSTDNVSLRLSSAQLSAVTFRPGAAGVYLYAADQYLIDICTGPSHCYLPGVIIPALLGGHAERAPAHVVVHDR